MSEIIMLEVLRYHPETDSEPYLQRYTVPYRDEWVVLDALNQIEDRDGAPDLFTEPLRDLAALGGESEQFRVLLPDFPILCGRQLPHVDLAALTRHEAAGGRTRTDARHDV